MGVEKKDLFSGCWSGVRGNGLLGTMSWRLPFVLLCHMKSYICLVALAMLVLWIVLY